MAGGSEGPWGLLAQGIQDTNRGIGTGMQSYYQTKSTKKGQESAQAGEEQMLRDILLKGQQRTGEYQQAYGGALAGLPGATQEYLDSLAGYDAGKYQVQAPEDEFQYDLKAKTAEMMNPEIEAILSGARGQVEGSAANRGSLFSGSTGRGIQRASADIIANEYGQARSAAMQDKASTYQQWADKFNRVLQQAQQNQSAAQGGMQAKQAGMQTRQNLFSGQQELQGGVDTAELQSKGRINELQAQRSGLQSPDSAKWSGFLMGLGGGQG